MLGNEIQFYCLLLRLIIAMGLVSISSCITTQIPLYNEQQVTATVNSDETTCYLFEMDSNKTREVVYWAQAKLYLRLEPCIGMPHLKVSVYGCPSDGNIVNWEYMSDRARADLLAQGQAVPSDRCETIPRKEVH